MYSHYANQHGNSSEKLKIDVPHNPAITIFDIYKWALILLQGCFLHSFNFCSTHSSQKLERSWISFNRRVDEENTEHLEKTENYAVIKKNGQEIYKQWMKIKKSEWGNADTEYCIYSLICRYEILNKW